MYLSDPIPALGDGQSAVTCQMTLKTELVEMFVIECAEIWCHAAKHSDEPELRGDAIHNETEPDVRRELETRLSFTLHLG